MIPFQKPSYSIKRFVYLLLGGSLLGALGWLVTPEETALSQPASPTVRPTPDLAAGKVAYEENCARCHGLTGAGDGADAKRMFPKPRNLADGVFKFRTTASGTPPTDEDLFHTISTGLPGSRMPDFQRLPEETRWQLVYTIKSLAPIFAETPSEPVDLGNDPGPQTNLQKGKELYTQLGCNACHGNFGRGDGPSAPTLVDNWEIPILAADLTKGWGFRAGSKPKDIATRILTGIDGAPMPSYLDALESKEDAWHLAYYVHSLQEPPRFSRTIEAIKVQGALPRDLDDPAWEKAPRTDLRCASTFYLQGQIQPTTVNSVSIQALYNDKETAFLFSWHDPTESAGLKTGLTVEAGIDASEVGAPDTKEQAASPDSLALVLVPERKLRFQIGSLRSWPASKDAPPLTVCLWKAGEAAEEAVVPRFEAFEAEGENWQGIALESQAAYGDGRWRLLIRRPLVGDVPGSVTLDPKAPNLIAIAVWDGGNQEQGRRRASSNWVDLVFK